MGQDFIVKAAGELFSDEPSTQLTVADDASFKLELSTPQKSKEFLQIFPVSGFDFAYLASDVNPFGEALASSWHNCLTPGLTQVKRIHFNEITWSALASAIDNPVAVNECWVNAHMARSGLEQMFRGFFQPTVRKNIANAEMPNLLQCLMLRLLCEREAAVANFVPQEIWHIKAEFKCQNSPVFGMDLQDMAIHSNQIPTQAHGIAIQDILKSQLFTLKDFNVTQRSQAPAAPFTTATLIQAAFERFGFGARQTLEIARQLYSGLSLGRAGWTGLISFWATETVRNPRTEIDQAREFIWINYGNDYLPAKPRLVPEKNRSESGPGSIRPTDIKRLPKTIKKNLSPEQYQLYDLIWRRFIASQMAEAQIEECSATVVAGEPERFLFGQKSSQLKFRGYLQVYEENKPTSPAKSADSARLPLGLVVGEKCELKNFYLSQQPSLAPERYAESELALLLLNQGLARPGELKAIFDFLLDRGYVECEQQRLKPNALAQSLNQFLIMNFPSLLDVKFLGRVQKTLNLIERGDLPYQEALFALQESLKKAFKRAQGPKSGLKNGPETGNAADPVCEQCGSRMISRNGRHGRFWACKNYPRCKATRPFTIGVNCPQSDCDGQIIERKSSKGTIFFGCSNYPVCKFASWHRLVDRVCKNCGHGYLEERQNENLELFLQCPKCKTQFSADLLTTGEDGAQ